MKRIVLFFVIVFFSCNKQEDKLNLSDVFTAHIKEYQISRNKSSAVDLQSLYNRLDHTKNYEETIFNYMINYPAQPGNPNGFYSIQSGYSGFDDFDRILIEVILNDILKLDGQAFFDKVDYIGNFIEKHVQNSMQRNYWLNALEEYKWIKYTRAYIKLNFAARNAFDDCFDECMTRKIRSTLDDATWLEWAYFLSSAAYTVAVWFASCTWNCS